MSRLGKLPVSIPQGVTVAIAPGRFTAKGPKGEVSEHMPGGVALEQADGVVKVSLAQAGSVSARAAWGLARMLVANAVKGVSQGYAKKLELSGIGFKAQVEGKDLVLSLGYSHPVRFPIPVGLSVTVEKMTITVSGASKQQVGQVAAEIRGLKPPEPYKGKGIRYADEVIRRKAGKVVKAAGAK